MTVQLGDSKCQLLCKLQKAELAKRNYVKITVILMLDQGFGIDKIAMASGIDYTTVYGYAYLYCKSVGRGLIRT